MVRNYKKDGKRDSGFVTKKWMVRTSFKPGDIGSLTALHGTIYAKEYGLDHTFEAYVAAGLAQFLQSFHPKKDRAWVAEINDQIIGMIAIAGQSKGESQLHWFLVHPDFRRCGLGTELLREALLFCKKCKYKTVFLWTINDLRAAGRLYTCAGFRKTQEKTHDRWGRRVTEERYELHISDTSE